jgi:hypothetical protein
MIRYDNLIKYSLFLLWDILTAARVSYDLERKFGRSSGEMPKGE